MKNNPIQTVSFRIEQGRRKNREVVAEESLILTAMLYGALIEDGRKSIQDYKNMTGAGFNRELRLRSIMYSSERRSKERAFEEEKRKKEDSVLEMLKNMT